MLMLKNKFFYHSHVFCFHIGNDKYQTKLALFFFERKMASLYLYFQESVENKTFSVFQ